MGDWADDERDFAEDEALHEALWPGERKAWNDYLDAIADCSESPVVIESENDYDEDDL